MEPAAVSSFVESKTRSAAGSCAEYLKLTGRAAPSAPRADAAAFPATRGGRDGAGRTRTTRRCRRDPRRPLVSLRAQQKAAPRSPSLRACLHAGALGITSRRAFRVIVVARGGRAAASSSDDILQGRPRRGRRDAFEVRSDIGSADQPAQRPPAAQARARAHAGRTHDRNPCDARTVRRELRPPRAHHRFSSPALDVATARAWGGIQPAPTRRRVNGGAVGASRLFRARATARPAARARARAQTARGRSRGGVLDFAQPSVRTRGGPRRWPTPASSARSAAYRAIISTSKTHRVRNGRRAPGGAAPTRGRAWRRTACRRSAGRARAT